MSTHLSSKEVIHASQLLAKIQSSRLPFEIFKEVARLTVLPTIEIVPIKTTTAGPQVLLVQQSPTDPHWPGMWHVPGGVLIPTDQPYNFEQLCKRILTKRLNTTKLTTPAFITNVFCQTNRGAELALVYAAQVVGKPAVGTFFDIAALPPNIIKEHEVFIHHVAEKLQLTQ